jgi:hypothetical protein
MTPSSALHRYWIKFAAPAPAGFTLGCGVTAVSETEARELALKVCHGAPVITSIVSDVDVSTLDAKRVIPNMGDCTQRGVWFPNFGAG